jgi:hypothetical protein
VDIVIASIEGPVGWRFEMAGTKALPQKPGNFRMRRNYRGRQGL